jgi:hypothetical protein
MQREFGFHSSKTLNLQGWNVGWPFPCLACAGEIAGGSRSPAVVGVVDGGAYGHCFFVGGIEVSILTCLS